MWGLGNFRDVCITEEKQRLCSLLVKSLLKRADQLKRFGMRTLSDPSQDC